MATRGYERRPGITTDTHVEDADAGVSDDAGALGELAARVARTGVVLELVDLPPGRGQRCRFYALYLQPTLFGGVDMVRTCGR